MRSGMYLGVMIAGLLMGVAGRCGAAAETDAKTVEPGAVPAIRGMTGKVSDFRVAIAAPSTVAPLSDAAVPADVDLKRMAQWAMNYLIESPRKHLNYDPVFNCYTFRCPPTPEKTDPIVPCDTDARMDWEWYYMRDITGSERGRDVEAAFHKRMRGYIGDDGFVWCHPGAYNEGAIDAVYTKKDYFVHIWGSTKILKSLAEDYLRTKNPESKALARKIMLGLKKLSTWDNQGRCWIAAGTGGMKPDGSVVLPNNQPAPIVDPLITYWQATGDQEGLDFAKAYANGIIDHAQPGGLVFNPDGNFGNGHGHITMHAVWGVARLGAVTGEAKYTDFAKRVLDWMLSRGTGAGWFPAAPAWADNCSEVCLLSDMMSTAACVARAGHPEYYDCVERYLRNGTSLLQFICTPEHEAKYREINKALGKEKVEKGLAEVRHFQGGFFNCGLNDLENELLGKVGYAGEHKIAGCCAPEGIRSIYTTWLNTIEHRSASAAGPAGVYVNMSFSRDSEWGKVVSFMPKAGRLTVVAAVGGNFFLRPPHWASRGDVRAFVDSTAVPVRWSGDYVQFEAKPGAELTITYPLVAFTNRVEGLWKTAPRLVMTYKWLGNMVLEVDPPPAATATPLFTGTPRLLPSPPTQ